MSKGEKVDGSVKTGIAQLAPYIHLVRKIFEKGAPLGSALTTIKNQMRHIGERGLDVLTFNLGSLPFAINHNFVINTATLFSVAAFEYARVHGLHVPGSETLLAPITAASVSGSRKSIYLGDGFIVTRNRDGTGEMVGPDGIGTAADRGMSVEETAEYFRKPSRAEKNIKKAEEREEVLKYRNQLAEESERQKKSADRKAVLDIEGLYKQLSNPDLTKAEKARIHYLIRERAQR